MSEEIRGGRCGGCGVVVPGETPSMPSEARELCPNCGSVNRHLSVTIIGDGVDTHDSVSAKARHGAPGQVKPYLESKQGHSYYRNTGEWHDVRQIVDRDNNLYRKRVEDVGTGRVLKDVTEPLDQHVPDAVKRKSGDKTQKPPSEGTITISSTTNSTPG